MENEKIDERIVFMQEVIKNARDKVAGEFNRTQNDWLSCFGSKIFQIETVLESPVTRSFFTEEAINNFIAEMEKIKEYHEALKEKYSGNEPNESEKESLFNMLEGLNKFL